jgi:hypothetical protein
MSNVYLFLQVLFGLLYAQCPNRCSRNGVCNSQAECECSLVFSGPDCSKRSCPKGVAFSDYAYETDKAHLSVECSGRGLCNSKTGKCSCAIGFTGSACERLSCPNHCSHRGRCVSKKQIIEDRVMRATSFVYNYSEWDSNSIFGCICDYGYSGYDCSFQKCYDGDDPLTPGGEQGIPFHNRNLFFIPAKLSFMHISLFL